MSAPEPSGRALRNGCAQAAVATLVAHHGLPAPSVAEVYRRFPPDTPFAVLGTSPARLAAACNAFGLPARATAFRNGAAARESLARRLDEGKAVAVLLDLRHLGRRWPGGHYVVAYAHDEQGVHVTNMVRTPRFGAPRAHLPWADFERAWACRLAPWRSWRHASVAC